MKKMMLFPNTKGLKEKHSLDIQVQLDEFMGNWELLVSSGCYTRVVQSMIQLKNADRKSVV